MTEGVLRSLLPRASPKGRAPGLVDDGVVGDKLGPPLGGSDSDLFKLGNMSFHLRSHATKRNDLVVLITRHRGNFRRRMLPP
jgi:hypothetical protein